jgi:glycosyltransferase involved in cell wall biosynthesis
MTTPIGLNAAPVHVSIDAPADPTARPATSVIMSIFNNARHVAQAVDSVLSQDVVSASELILADDGSTDGTLEILQDYRARFPSTIRLAVASRNTAGIGIFRSALRAARGANVALIDGDDYWTAPAKLSRQLAFLDDHPECSMCFHNVLVYHEDESREPHDARPETRNGFLDQRDLLVRNSIFSCAPLIRTPIVQGLPEWVFALELGDWAIYVMAAGHGPVGYLDEPMAAYRVHRSGAWSRRGRRDQLEATIRFYEEMRTRLNGAHADVIDRQREVCRQELRIHAWTAWTSGDHRDALVSWTALARHDPGALARELDHRFIRSADRRTPAFDGSDEQPRFEGYQETLDDFVVRGWAWDSTRPDTPIEIDIFDGDLKLATVTADTFRTDLRDAGKGRGCHAFMYRLPDRLRDGRPHRIGSRFSGTDIALMNSGAIVAFADPDRPDLREAMRAEQVRWFEHEIAAQRAASHAVEAAVVAADQRIVDLRRELDALRDHGARLEAHRRAAEADAARLQHEVAACRDAPARDSVTRDWAAVSQQLKAVSAELEAVSRDREAITTTLAAVAGNLDATTLELNALRTSPKRLLAEAFKVLKRRLTGR